MPEFSANWMSFIDILAVFSKQIGYHKTAQTPKFRKKFLKMQ